MTELTMDALAERYIQLRDWKQETDRAHKAEMARADQVLNKMEARMLQMMQAQGVESVRTPHGTAYQSTKMYVGVADWDIALDFIRKNELWNMLEKRVSKTAVDQYKEVHDDVPPGLNIRQELTVNFRRS
jgi:hypothetical protein